MILSFCLRALHVIVSLWPLIGCFPGNITRLFKVFSESYSKLSTPYSLKLNGQTSESEIQNWTITQISTLDFALPVSNSCLRQDHDVAFSSFPFRWIVAAVVASLGFFSIDNGTAMRTMPLSKTSLAEWREISMLRMQHAFYDNSVPSSAKHQRAITIFAVVMTSWTYQGRAHQSSDSALSLQHCRMRTKWDNCKIVTKMQIFLFK